MKVPRHVVDDRRRKLAALLSRHRYLPVQNLCAELGVSEATVRRDLIWLEQNNLITRTYGGALAEFNQRFPSFRQRMSVGSGPKETMAARIHGLLRPGMTIFFDGGTTVYALAEALHRRPVLPMTALTINMPVADLLAEVDGVEMHLTGGILLRRQSVLGGAGAIHAVSRWQFDLALCSAQGMTRDGLWNSEPEIVALQKEVAQRSKRVVFLLDASKLGRTSPHFLLPWSQIHGLVTDATPQQLLDEGIQPKVMEVEQMMKDLSLGAEATVSPAAAEVSRNSDLTFPTVLL